MGVARSCSTDLRFVFFCRFSYFHNYFLSVYFLFHETSDSSMLWIRWSEVWEYPMAWHRPVIMAFLICLLCFGVPHYTSEVWTLLRNHSIPRFSFGAMVYRFMSIVKNNGNPYFLNRSCFDNSHFIPLVAVSLFTECVPCLREGLLRTWFFSNN